MRVLVVGANGMLGHVLTATLCAEYGVVAVSHGSVPVALREIAPRAEHVGQVDVADLPRIAALMRAARCDVVINCVGWVPQRDGGDDVVRQIAINALWPRQLAALADAAGSKLIQVSTDCVFSGSRGAYSEADVPDATEVYGRCKLLGEVLHPPHLTLRTSLIGRQLRGSYGLVEWLLRQAPGTVRGYTRAVFSGLHTAAFARLLQRLLEVAPERTGIYHVAATPISKCDLLTRVRDRLALDLDIVADDAVVCDRSLDGSLLTRATGLSVPSWERMIDDLALASPSYDGWRQSP